jgi:HD-GYP domain-containing protein (c-di-GMP phosphodiesterase class II)
VKKIVQTQIDFNYLSIDPTMITVGTIIEFDCYIKRYRDYVIIIDKGTKITQTLYDNLSKHKNIYIHQLGQEAYAHYSSIHKTTQTASSSTITKEVVQEIIYSDTLLEKKISTLYLYAFNIMYRFFSTESEEIAMQEIEVYIESLIHIMKKNSYTLQEFLAVLPDDFTLASHSVSVSLLSTLLANELNMTDHQLNAVCLAALLHDIGNLKMEDSILYKKSVLSSDEFEALQQHVEKSIDIAKLNGIHDSKILLAIECHHEKLDGSGYPKQLIGNQIPISAQIITICDIFDALTTHRTYRKKYSSFDTLMLMQRDMKKELNLKFVKYLIEILHKQ